MMSRVLSATVTVSASPDRVSELLTDPATHGEFNATGMVGHPVTPAPRTRF
jgi:uncharacterized protein YndB with AHSA1/START domain